MKQVWVKNLELHANEVEGATHYIDYETYTSACSMIDRQDALIDTLVAVIKEHGKTTTSPVVREAVTNLVLKVAKLRGM